MLCSGFFYGKNFMNKNWFNSPGNGRFKKKIDEHFFAQNSLKKKKTNKSIRQKTLLTYKSKLIFFKKVKLKSVFHWKAIFPKKKTKLDLIVFLNCSRSVGGLGLNISWNTLFLYFNIKHIYLVNHPTYIC